MSELPFAATTPIRVASVGLKARDAEQLAKYYQQVIGLQAVSRDGGTITLGAGGRRLLVIEQDNAARPDDPRSAGLYHTAFLMPSRVDLGRWVRHAIENRFPVDGASDHTVSEALYLTDPEGNGIEIYADRPHETWTWNNNLVTMGSDALDIPGLLAAVPAGDAGWKGVPDNSVIGHVHLRVGDPNDAEAWWAQEFGFDTVAKFGGSAVFLSSGGYHHHIGANSWQSARAGKRDAGLTGLSWVEMETTQPRSMADKRDPWGTVFHTVAAKA